MRTLRNDARVRVELPGDRVDYIGVHSVPVDDRRSRDRQEFDALIGAAASVGVKLGLGVKVRPR